MTWITFLTGLALFALGAGSRWLIPLQQWQALLPLVFGLAFLTLAEGMRSKPALRRFFLFLAILWSMVVLAVSVPYAVHIVKAWNLQPVVIEDVALRPELVLEHSSVFAITLLYFLIALVQFFKKPRVIAPGSAATPGSPSPSR